MFLIGVCLVFAVPFFSEKKLAVILYNDTSRTIHRVSLAVGNQKIDSGVLEPGESIVLHFQPPAKTAGVQLTLDGEPPVAWRAPELAGPEVSSITLRVDESGAVTVTVEPWLGTRIWRMLE